MRYVNRIQLLRPDLSPERINQILDPANTPSFTMEDWNVQSSPLERIISYDNNTGSFNLSPAALQRARMELPEFAELIDRTMVSGTVAEGGAETADMALETIRNPYESDGDYLNRLRSSALKKRSSLPDDEDNEDDVNPKDIE